MDILARAAAAGVRCWDGTGRALHVSLARNIDAVIANGLDLEPGVEAARAVLMTRPEQVLKGLSLGLEASGALQGFLALPAADAEVLARVARARRGFPHVTVVPLADRYPAAAPSALLAAVLERQVPSGGSPEDAGAAVIGVQGLIQLAEAVRGGTVSHGFVTVMGGVRRPQTVWAPMGAPVKDLVTLAGGSTVADPACVLGGPMAGQEVDWEGVLPPGSSGLLVLKPDHPVIRRLRTPLSVVLKRAASACVGCRMCTDRCPQHLLGYGIHPHLLLRGISHRLETESEVVTGAAACTGCQLCEAICPTHLAPGRVYAAVAESLRGKGLAEMPRVAPRAPLAAREGRGVGREWLLARVGLGASRKPLPIGESGAEGERKI